MWVAKRFDLGWADLAAAFGHCLRADDALAASAEVEALWSDRGDALACLSVRSAFDLYLEARRFPPGSEIVFSAMTVADMPRIALRHGLVPVPCDIDAATAAPSVRALRHACSERTRAVVLAHLFGARMPFDDLVALAHERGIEVVEDCAEAYAGRGWTGHPASDVTLFSFGPIKHATALGGGVARVRDPQILERMREVHAGWPKQRTAAYALRVVKYAALHALSGRVPYTLISTAARFAHVDLDRLMNRLTRGFGDRKLFRRIRRRPSGALLRTLARRLGQGARHLALQEARGRALVARSGIEEACPGHAARPHTFWLLPVLAEDPHALVRALRHAGFAASRGRSFTVVGDGAPDGRSPGAARVHTRAVYVPFYPAMSDAAVERLAEALASASHARSTPQAASPPAPPPASTSTP